MSYHQKAVELAHEEADKVIADFRSCFQYIEDGKPNPDYIEGKGGRWNWDDHWDGELVRIIRLIADIGYQVCVPGNVWWSALRKGKVQIKSLLGNRVKKDFVYAILEMADDMDIPVKKIEIGRQNFVHLDMNKVRRKSTIAKSRKKP